MGEDKYIDRSEARLEQLEEQLESAEKALLQVQPALDGAWALNIIPDYFRRYALTDKEETG